MGKSRGCWMRSWQRKCTVRSHMLGKSFRSAFGRGAAAGVSYLSSILSPLLPLLRRASVQEEGS